MVFLLMSPFVSNFLFLLDKIIGIAIGPSKAKDKFHNTVGFTFLLCSNKYPHLVTKLWLVYTYSLYFSFLYNYLTHNA